MKSLDPPGKICLQGRQSRARDCAVVREGIPKRMPVVLHGIAQARGSNPRKIAGSNPAHIFGCDQRFGKAVTGYSFVRKRESSKSRKCVPMLKDRLPGFCQHSTGSNGRLPCPLVDTVYLLQWPKARLSAVAKLH